MSFADIIETEGLGDRSHPAGGAERAAVAVDPPRDVVRACRVGTFTGLARALDRDPAGTVVLDVRRDSERAAGHLEGSVRITLHEVRARAAELPAGTVWVHCAAGARAAAAASLLAAAGREAVLVHEALDAAAGAGLPVVSPARARVTARQARARTGPRGGAVLLDVREEDEWRAGHAPGAVHLPLSALLAGDGVPEAVRDREAVVVCRSGQRSQKGARALAGRGARAVDVEGGMRAWARAGYPVVDEHGNPGTVA
ncbi:rhodanese-like domain-containing protein [Streptomyces fradiae]|uniref:rhodanese-like domain-containing protein n=1 Tax=Streptomyces fradiae TaxID=1906 RepID=UPI0036474AA9